MDNLLVAWFRFRRGKKKKTDVRFFELTLGDNLAKIYEQLEAKSYVHAGYSVFNVSDPKPRIIHKAQVVDRVVHRLIYDTLYWYFHARFIHDSYSCRRGGGPHKAIERFKKFAGQVSENHTRTAWVLKCDIRKFFASIDHARLKQILTRHIRDPELLWLCDKVTGSFHSGIVGKGLPLGNLTSQLFGNVYMHELDMYIKQELRVKHYIRYADDFILLSYDRSELENLLPKIRDFLLSDLKLDLHKDKVFIKTYASGVDFLGWVHFPKYRVLRTSTKRRMLKNLGWYPKRETVNSYRGLLKHGNTHKVKLKTGRSEREIR